MLFETFIVDLFNSIKTDDGALTCFVYVDGEELMNTTCQFKDILTDADSSADRLSLAIDPVIGQAVSEHKSVSLMAVVSVGEFDEVYRFRYNGNDLECHQELNKSVLSRCRKKSECESRIPEHSDWLEIDNRDIKVIEDEICSRSLEESKKIYRELKPYFG